MVFREFKKTIRYKCGPAAFYLGEIYRIGNRLTQDLSSAVELYEKGAGFDNINSINELAVCLVQGSDINVDLPRAFELYKKSADNGNAMVGFIFDRCYFMVW